MFGKFLTMGAVAVMALSASVWAYPAPDSASYPTGPITYVDAIHTPDNSGAAWYPNTTNTNLANGTDLSSVAGTLASGSQADGQWFWRNFQNYGVNFDTGAQARSIYQSSGNVFSNNPADAWDAPVLKTRITGLTPGQAVHVYVYFWSNTASWRIWAGLDENNLSLYSANDGNGSYVGAQPTTRSTGPGGINVSEANGQLPDTTQYWANQAGVDLLGDGSLIDPVWPDVVESDRQMMEGYLGIGIADANGEIAVFVDDEDFNNPTPGVGIGDQAVHNYRTWYDGVGYAVPEPATMALLGLGGLVMIARRRA